MATADALVDSDEAVTAAGVPSLKLGWGCMAALLATIKGELGDVKKLSELRREGAKHGVPYA